MRSAGGGGVGGSHQGKRIKGKRTYGPEGVKKPEDALEKFSHERGGWWSLGSGEKKILLGREKKRNGGKENQKNTNIKEKEN